jgi:hypothetical protein
LAVYPNDMSFPPSAVSDVLPDNVIVDDLRSILTAVHGAVVAQLHSYEFAPEVCTYVRKHVRMFVFMHFVCFSLNLYTYACMYQSIYLAIFLSLCIFEHMIVLTT